MAAFFQRRLRIEWGWCDPAGIVFAPRFIDMFSENTVQMFEFAGLPKKRDMREAMGVVGYPLVDLQARFVRPAAYGDDVIVESAAPDFGRSSFTIAHRILLGDSVCVEGTEKRVWTVYDEVAPGGIKSAPTPEDVRRLFQKT
ncbi:acyl-CoA thioesterase [Hyphococcus luteus]|uniref:Acyl-CoA thioesterase n=1 Tax=Hyphococcus luteus TaxID=2058213 RepID=A0A2S7K348_9PROT|nr:acyl-CoA thioesterase [Marinicaulis flavus]PQA86930.1 acyl-CoA thioesterase [Marinicaulis flavus]